MRSRIAPRLWAATILLAATASVEATFSEGGFAFTKRVETKLLAEPNPSAAPAGKLGYQRKVKVEQVQGGWLRVSDGPTIGWVFSGNLSETKPDEGKGLDGAPLLASNTTATAAARPLTPAADEYSQRRNLGSANDDLNWLLNKCSSITPAQVETYLKTHRKGEYQ